MAEANLERTQRMLQVIKLLKKTYPEAHCYLHYETPFQLLVATMLSAQCTDERVNKVTPVLFELYPDPCSMARVKIHDLEELIRSTGFYQMKAKAILETSRVLVEKYQGKVPKTLEELTALRGVGRKTANVVLGNAFGIPGMVVDTHVGRLMRRMGFTKHQDPGKVEKDLMRLVPAKDWTRFSHLLIAHGRAVCTARKAQCEGCAFGPDSSNLCQQKLMKN
jgi:endonuclease-3